MPRNLAWDRYLFGHADALNDDARRGATIFYGKGRCVVCHSGPLFSDFKYYSIEVFNTGAATASIKEDLGRYNATNIEEDKYKFRTPPLRNVIHHHRISIMGQNLACAVRSFAMYSSREGRQI